MFYFTSDRSFTLISYTPLCYVRNEAPHEQKCAKFDFGWGSAPDPAGRAHSAPHTPWLDLRGRISKGREGKGNGGEGGKARGGREEEK